MIRMFPRRRQEIEIPVGLDRVIFGISLPSESILNAMWAEVHLVGQAVLPASQAIMYQIQGYILPILDPDEGNTMDSIWDQLVPKDDDVDTIDLDTAAADTLSMFEPGEMALAEVMDLGLQPEKLYSKSFMRSFATSNFKQEDTSVLEWVPNEVVKIRLGKKRRFRCDGPSIAVFGLGNADLLDTVAQQPIVLAENEWPRVKYMGTVLEQSLMQHFGLIETGAETPWVDAATLLRKYIEPDVVENDAGAWSSATLRAFVNVTFDVSVPGEMSSIQIGSGG